MIAALDLVVDEIHRGDLDPIVKRRPEIAEGLAAVMADHQARTDRHSRTAVATRVPSRDDLLRAFGCCSALSHIDVNSSVARSSIE